jgi:hypothetical protein
VLPITSSSIAVVVMEWLLDGFGAIESMSLSVKY